MKTLAGIALGFSMVPTLFGTVVGFAVVAAKFDLSKGDAILGGFIGVAVIIGLVNYATS